MRLTLIQVPYDSGHCGERMGRGPIHLIEKGLVAALEQAGLEVNVAQVHLEGFLTEVTSAPALYSEVSAEVAAARWEGCLPVVLSGNCNTAAVGALTGIGGAGVVWMDAHGDLNTPETTPSGFFDGMALTVATGKSWRTLTAPLRGFQPLDERNLIHVGARDFDPPELELIKGSPITLLQVEDLRRDGIEAALGGALDDLASRVEQVYVHIDLDVLDPSELRANSFAVPGGLTVAEVEEIIRTIGRHLRIAAAGLTSYDPDEDPEGRGLKAAERFLMALAAKG